MALELSRGLSARVPQANLTFAVVPDSEEAKWAKRYGLNIVRRLSRFEYLATFLPYWVLSVCHRLTGKSGFERSNCQLLKEVKPQYLSAVASADLILNMSGIAYIGDGAMSRWRAYIDHFPCALAHKFNKPYAAFIQSYGPFDDPFVAWFAKREFIALPFIPARGSTSARNCRNLVSDSIDVVESPDVAIKLPVADSDWTDRYLDKLGFKRKDYIAISPSAVMQNDVSSQGGASGNNSVHCFSAMLESFLALGHKVLLLGHMYHDTRPSKCDRRLCRDILNHANSEKEKAENARVVEVDLDPMQAKALIEASKLSIVSRYHALVAAVSTATPVVAVGWNDKYRDILAYYQLGDLAIDGRQSDPNSIVGDVMDKAAWWESNRAKVEANWEELHKANLAKVDQAFDKLSSWIESVAKNR